MSKKIFWIASYPKSGNTLIRAILASLFFTKDGIFSFEILKKILLRKKICKIIKNCQI